MVSEPQSEVAQNSEPSTTTYEEDPTGFRQDSATSDRTATQSLVPKPRVFPQRPGQWTPDNTNPHSVYDTHSTRRFTLALPGTLFNSGE